MQLQTHAWERPLLALAYEAQVPRRKNIPDLDEQVGGQQVGIESAINSTLLQDAYAYCESITAVHSRSFHIASSLLPPAKRRAARALYAFCRVTDDIVDGNHPDARALLHDWHGRVMTASPPSDDLVALAWTDTRLRYEIPLRYAEQLIEGVGQDLKPVRYQTFDELAAYSYGVASTVGLMSMHIIGYHGADAIPYAVKLGVALQITNILRDVAEDYRNGRIYLPMSELKEFGLSEQDIAYGRVSDSWREFMQFQIARNRRLYDESLPGIRYLEQDGRFSIAAAADLYRAILSDIEAHDYDVFSRRAKVSSWGKIRRLPQIWLRSQTLS